MTEFKTTVNFSKLIMETLENIDQGISVFDSNLKLIAFNTKFCELLDFPCDMVKIGMPMETLFRYNAKRGEYGTGDIEKMIQERIAMALRFEPHRFERVRPDKTSLEIVGNPLPSGGFVTTYTDITTRKSAEEQLRESHHELEKRVAERTKELQLNQEKLKHLALTDPLTGLANRRKFNQHLEQASKRTKRTKQLGAVLYMDLDDFKQVNDTYGHQAGDWVLSFTAKRLQNCLRETDLVARLGGDEFAVILEFVEKEENAYNVANQIVHALSKPFKNKGITVTIGVSLGIAFFHEKLNDPDLLLRLADSAMYQAKRSGKGCIMEQPANS